MAEQTKIEWCDHTFNPWRGCTKVAEGCKFCYADTLSKRNPGTLGVWGDNGTRVMAAESYWREPLKWNRQSELDGERRRVFCASLADVFENWEGVIFAPGKQPVILNKRWHASARMADRATLDDVRARLFALIAATPNLDWLLLTKRPENIGPMWPMPMNDREPGDELVLRRENVWLLTSIAEQTDVDRNLPLLLNHRDMAPVLGLSCEPLIGPLQLGLDRIWCRYHQCFEASACMDESEPCFRWQSIVGDMLDWVIVGGESGHHARPMHPDWARSIRDQCQAAGVPYFFKQWGEWIEGDVVPGGDLGGDFRRGKANILAGDGSENDGHFRRARRDVIVRRVGKKAAGRLLDGREWNEYPRVEVAAN